MARGALRCTRLRMRQWRSIPRSCAVAETRRPGSLRAQRKSLQISDLRFQASDSSLPVFPSPSLTLGRTCSLKRTGLNCSFRVPIFPVPDCDSTVSRVHGSDPTGSGFLVPSSGFPVPLFRFPGSAFSSSQLPAFAEATAGYRLLATGYQERTSAHEST
jgi:hypothetical protein